MHVFARREIAVLLGGDILALFAGLWLALALRSASIPTTETYSTHVVPFSILFAFSIISFLIAGLYEKHTTTFVRHLPQRLINAQIINVAFAVTIFYVLPLFQIAPKTILVLYLACTSVLIIFWRLYGREVFGARTRTPAIVIGAGKEVDELKTEVNNNSRYHLRFDDDVDLLSVTDAEAAIRLTSFLKKINGSLIVVADVHNARCEPLLTQVYEHMPAKVSLLNFNTVYEDVFDRVALTSFNPTLFLVAISTPSYALYTQIKRVMDIVLSMVLLVLFALAYPFLWIAIKLEDGGDIFITQRRIGRNGKPFIAYKLRTMTGNDNSAVGFNNESPFVVTRIGQILRRTSIDEFPQVVNVFKGDMSLIGPRANVEGEFKKSVEQIPHYALRCQVKPGISGWAQTKQLYKKGNISPQSTEETTLRLAYDLYYVKHRSIWLDLKIALRTAPIMVSRLRFW